MPPCALIVGSPGVGKFSLAKALGAQPAAKTDCNEYSLNLDTKYYTADVVLLCAARPSLPGSLEALVLVFDASDRSSFDSIRSWADQQDAEAVEVKLVVANKADLQQREPGPRAPWLDDAAAWCCNAGYEFIEAAAGRPSLDAQLEVAGEQQGTARVLAALQAHVWPGLVQKPWKPAGTQQLPLVGRGAVSSRPAGSSSTSSGSSSQRDQGLHGPAGGPAGAAASAGGAADSDVLQQRGSPAQLEAAAAAAAAQQLASQAAAEPSHTAQLQEQQQRRAALVVSSSSSSSSNGAAAAAANGTAATSAATTTGSSSDVQKPAGQHEQQPWEPAAADAAAEAAAAGSGGSGSDREPHGLALDEFEQLMKQAAGMRGRLSGLPDTERRAAAADMALRLAAAMGLGGGDSDGSSDNDDDDDDDDDVVEASSRD